jgi:hypothetical protein
LLSLAVGGGGGRGARLEVREEEFALLEFGAVGVVFGAELGFAVLGARSMWLLESVCGSEALGKCKVLTLSDPQPAEQAILQAYSSRSQTCCPSS